MINREGLFYTKEHEWLAIDGDVATVGITEYAAEKLGDVVYVDLPKVGTQTTYMKICGEIESTKSVGELYAPVDGEVVAVNETVASNPELINHDAFGAGWLIKIRFTELPTLLSPRRIRSTHQRRLKEQNDQRAQRFQVPSHWHQLGRPAAHAETLGYDSIDDLMSDAVPQVIRFNGEGTLPEPISEPEALGELRALASRNRITASMIGLGYYGTHVPGVIKRNVLENPSWYTAYTPYQPEISQGRLEALINFQTMVTDLTGMKTANASMLDEGTAVVEAMMIARRSSDSKSNVFYVDSDALPQTKALLEHRAEPLGIEVQYFDASAGATGLVGEYFGLMLQYPGAAVGCHHRHQACNRCSSRGFCHRRCGRRPTCSHSDCRTG